MTKICSVCDEDLPLKDFNLRCASKDGYQHKCRNCQLDYQHKRFNQTPRRIVKDGFQYCPTCRQELPFNLFGSNVSRSNFLNMYCKKCTNTQNKQQYYKKNTEDIRAKYIQLTYNLSWEDYVNMFANQDGKCAICNTDIFLAANDRNKTAHIDHAHENGKIRGLLCGNCNVSLGGFNDDVKIMQNAIDYINSTSEEL